MFRNEHPFAPTLTFESIRIDSSSTILISPPSSPKQQSIAGSLSSDISTLCEFFLDIHRTFQHKNRLTLPLDPEQEDIVFARIMVALIQHFVASGDLKLLNSSPTDHFQSLTDFDDIDHSEQLLLTVRQVKETLSLEAVRNDYFDWKEWVTMMEMVEQGVVSLSDLSFLQSRCFRSTLETLQTKHQHRSNLSHIGEYSQTPSVSDKLSTYATHVPSEIDVTWNMMGRILITIHPLLTRPHPTSFPWGLRLSTVSDSEADALLVPSQFVDLNEKFDISLFDEIDDLKVMTSLRKCLNVLNATKSTECIVDVHTFRTLLISGLHSSNLAVQIECYRFFFLTQHYHPTIDDPRDTQFQGLRTAFRDGTFMEKMVLLRLWETWSKDPSKYEDVHSMKESDFDFNGLLAVDLSENSLFDIACSFLANIMLNDSVSMSFGWKMNFLLKFENRHRVLDRLTNDPSQSSDQKRSEHFLSPIAITLGSFLSIFRGIDFPSALTELMTIDLDISPLKYSHWINPAIFLNHTSIAPKHRHSFFPMDLMFEAFVRKKQHAFFRLSPALNHCTPRKFLHTPYVGLHSLLLRYPNLNLDQQSLANLINMFFVEFGQDTTPANLHDLFGSFPPPRFIDTLLYSHHAVRTSSNIWIGFLNIICTFGIYTSPFGACSSLAQVFKMLVPYDSNPNEVVLRLLSRVGSIVVSLHWLSIPAHFDSPLLCHLPSLAGAQKGVLQTLSSHFGIPSLVTPNHAKPDWNTFKTIWSTQQSVGEIIDNTCLCVRYLEFNTIVPLPITISQYPALVSVAFDFFCRFFRVSSDAVRIKMVKRGLLDRVVFVVSNSSFLDDYEKGVAVIGILLDTIRRDNQTQRMRDVDFSSLF
ncbi:hypothetical protein BLNAU_9862 [Blattamonas nauphoetae]|uniref:Uncharacterized protein n=1 Tax=Blattamonas nauphoetae TaxID=2049346 RepID=A0ABQ9XUH8_9EUKA|nr:hypothetical protein BLNAU_9862 [Blattamonas nauphoetae]